MRFILKENNGIDYFKIANQIVNMSDDELLQLLNASYSRLSDTNPMFVLNNGEILDVKDVLNKNGVESKNYKHEDLLILIAKKIVEQQLSDDEEIEYASEDIAFKYFDYILYKKNWCRLNPGNSNVEKRFYCVLPVKINNYQFYTLEDFINSGVTSGRKNVTVFYTIDQDTEDYHMYSLQNKSTEEIIKLLKLYKVNGYKFLEKLSSKKVRKSV